MAIKLVELISVSGVKLIQVVVSELFSELHVPIYNYFVKKTEM